MKKLLLITALFCSIGFAKAQDATLEETTDWIRDKIKSNLTFCETSKFSFSATSCRSKSESPYVYFLSGSSDGDFNYFEVSHGCVFNGFHDHLTQIFLGGIKSISVEGDKLIITGGVKQSESLFEHAHSTPFIKLTFSSDITKRMLKAFLHACELVGNKIKEEKF